MMARNDEMTKKFRNSPDNDERFKETLNNYEIVGQEVPIGNFNLMHL